MVIEVIGINSIIEYSFRNVFGILKLKSGKIFEIEITVDIVNKNIIYHVEDSETLKHDLVDGETFYQI